MYFFFLFFLRPPIFLFFFFNDTATTEIYTLSLHDALPILPSCLDRDTRRTPGPLLADRAGLAGSLRPDRAAACGHVRSEEHTSELQSLAYLVCRLLLEKKKNKDIIYRTN